MSMIQTETVFAEVMKMKLTRWDSRPEIRGEKYKIVTSTIREKIVRKMVAPVANDKLHSIIS